MPETGAEASGGCLAVASYNVHCWVGRDGRYDLSRVTGVLRELRADVVALQEVAGGPESADGDTPLDLVSHALGAAVVRGPTLERKGFPYGNAVMTRLPVLRARRLDLSVGRGEPRGALDLLLEAPGLPLRVLATHLSLRAPERRLQVRRLVEALDAGERDLPVVLLGDMNEWVRGMGALRPLHRCLGRTPGRRTFPSGGPILSLDRIWVRPRERLAALVVHRSPAARVASDHLPIRAELRWPEADPSHPPGDPGGGRDRIPPRAGDPSASRAPKGPEDLENLETPEKLESRPGVREAGRPGRAAAGRAAAVWIP